MFAQVTLSGCDDSTVFRMEVSAEQFAFLEGVAALATKTSTYSCQPRMEVISVDSLAFPKDPWEV